MLIVYLTIPLMLLAMAVAVLPLWWATKYHQGWEDHAKPAVSTIRPAYVVKDRATA